MATPSSKPNPGATPTHLTSSPRPSGVPMARPMSHKSPSARSPSATGHLHGSGGHAPLHQYSTPLAVAAGGLDDPVNFSSPSALLALGGYSGISPSPATHEVLVGAGMHDSDIHALGMHGFKIGNARDSDEERRRHIEDVVQMLRTRVAGRGVCREGIERLGQLEGFESIWQEDNLSIAGNFVDLEIEFHPGKHTVKDVSLKYATPEATEGEGRDEATAVLKRDLMQSSEEIERGAWKSLTGFYENLRWLAKLDRLSQEVNCFEAIEGLYESLKRIWDEESKHLKFSEIYEHLCSGWVGRPSLHRGGRIGISLDYWIYQARILDAKRKNTSPDAMVLDNADQEFDIPQHRMWSVMIECEEGYPSLRVSKDWVNSEVLTPMSTDKSSAPNENDTTDIPTVNWAEPPMTTTSDSQGNPGAMTLDSGMLGSSTPNRRFVAKIEPPLDVPILAASDIYRQLGLQLPQEFRMVTYDGLLVPGSSPLFGADIMGFGTDEPPQADRRKRRLSVQAFDSEGKPCKKQHGYTFQAFESVAGRTMRDIPFSHPRQLAEILPVLRQYATLENMIQKIFYTPSRRHDSKQNGQRSTSLDRKHQAAQSSTTNGKGNVTILSNQDPNEQKLDALMKGLNVEGVSIDNDADDVKIDITLRTQLGQAPVIMLLFTINDASIGNDYLKTFSISFEVGLNGHIIVVDTSGLWEEPVSGEDRPEGADIGDQKDEASEMPKKIARALEVSQDLGILVEWVLRWRRQQKST